MRLSQGGNATCVECLEAKILLWQKDATRFNVEILLIKVSAGTVSVGEDHHKKKSSSKIDDVIKNSFLPKILFLLQNVKNIFESPCYPNLWFNNIFIVVCKYLLLYFPIVIGQIQHI